MSFRGLGLAVAFAGVLALPAASASGATVHKYDKALSERLTETVPGGVFVQPWGLTFDPTGSLYVADAKGKAVDVFDSTDMFSAQLGVGVLPEAYSRSVAVNNETGDVYVGESGPEDVYVFKPEGGGKYKPLQTSKRFGGYVYVGVNNASGERKGDVYVIAGGQVHVIKTNSEGELLEATEELLPAPPEGFSFNGPNNNNGLVVDASTGILYVANPGHGTVDEYSAGGVFLASLTGTKTFAESFVPVGVAVNESTHELYVADAAHQLIDEFTASGEFVSQISETEGSKTLVEPLGVAVQNRSGATQGDVYVSDGQAKVVDVFGPDEEFVLPTPVTEPSSEVGATTATLNGSVTPEAGKELTGLESSFEYALGAGGCTGKSTLKESLAGPSTVKKEAKLSELEPSKLYTFCFVASKSGIGSHQGNQLTLETLGEKPTIISESAGEITPTEATLGARVNPNNQETTCLGFEYGRVAASENKVPCAKASLGKGFEEAAATASLTGLTANTTYHYRALVENATGKREGVEEQFTTRVALAPTVVSESATAVTVSEATLGAQVNPNLEDTKCKGFEYGQATVSEHKVACEPVEADLGKGGSEQPAVTILHGLLANTTYHYRVVVENVTARVPGVEQTFTTAPPVPATDAPADNSTGITATLAGTLAAGSGGTSYYFQYGATVAYGVQTATAIAGATGGPQPVSVEVSVLELNPLRRLEPLHSYHYRLVVSNGSEANYGPDIEFKTPALPAVVATDEAAAVGLTSATLTGSILAQQTPGAVNAPTVYRLKYGTTTAYGSSTPDGVIPLVVEPGEVHPVLLAVPVSGLLAHTTYHYVLLAENAAGVFEGHDETFTTGSEEHEAPLAPGFSFAAAPFLAPAATPFADMTGLTPIPPKTVTPVKPKKPKKKTKKHKKHGNTKGKGKKTTKPRGGKR
jgi:DNA-binding beta-propeller fold protein YncE